MNRLAAVATALAASYLFAALVALATREAGYSHVRHTISEIGESGAPDQRLVAFALFLPIGLVAAIVA